MNEPLGQRGDGLIVFHRTLDDLVVNIRNVSDIGHPIALGLEPTIDHIENDQYSRMPHMTEVINRHAADIHAHMAGFDGLKFFFGTT